MEVIQRAYQIEDDVDPVQSIMQRVGNEIGEFFIGGQDVMVAVYEPSANAKFKGTPFYIPDKTRAEWRYQGVTGLVLKIGPLAFKTEKTEGWFVNDQGKARPPKVGEWVMFDIQTSRSFLFKDQPCRFVGAQYIFARIPRPDIVS